MTTTVAASTERLIDSVASPDPPPKIDLLVLGLSRTGTWSMCDALEILGIRAYHFRELFPNFKNGHYSYWKDALERKYYGLEAQYSKAEFDKILQGYTALSDAPCVNFSDELLEAYPDAKVILTTRDSRKWVTSMEVSYYALVESRMWQLAAQLDKALLRPYTDITLLVLSFWTKGEPMNKEKLAEGFRLHNEHIRSVVPPEKLLEFEAKDGWEPLCRFLGKPVPNVPYPNTNKGTSTIGLNWKLMRYRLLVVGVKWLIFPGTMITGFLAVGMTRRI